MPRRHIQMIPHQQKKRFPSQKVSTQRNCVSVAQALRLLHEMQSGAFGSRGRCVSFAVARTDDNADLLDASSLDLFHDDSQRGLAYSVPIDDRLQRKRTLSFSSCRDDSFFDFHEIDAVQARHSVANGTTAVNRVNC